ncbi:MAG: tRNA1(Val) (adenine(37)-N6)-methyltransferase [Clostridia bacterium]|nr:tRNA1(Val) (adenine(37)-N6)-methyltransferase [Clostridia bacterium]
MCLQNADLVKDDETLEDLQISNLQLIQKKDGFRFGIDAVLLSDFAKDIRAEKMLDMCTGSGIIPVLMTAKTNIPEIFGMEIQEEIFDTAKRTLELNNLCQRVHFECGDIKNAVEIYGKRQFDLITCNPPYMPAGTAVKNELDTKIIARHEVMCTLEDVISVGAMLVKQHGHLVLVHKPSRLADIICLMREHKIEPKRIRFIHKQVGAEPSLVLVDGAYLGGHELRILPPLYIFDETGEETPELKRIYGR